LTRRRPDITPEQNAERDARKEACEADRREAALAAARSGRLFLGSDNYREALASFSEALRGSSEADLSVSERAALLCDLARCHLGLGSHQEARRCLESAARLPLSDEHRCFAAEIDVVLAKVQAKSGRFAESLHAARRAYEILKHEPDSALMAEASKALGTAHAELGSVTEARDCFTECLVCCRRLEDEDGVAGAYNNLGILAKRSGDLAAAIDYFERALAIDERLGRPASIARRLNNLGLALYRMSRWDEAEHHLLRARDNFISLGATRDVVSVESALGNLRRVRRDWAGARRHFDRALELSREHGYLRAEALAMEFLGDLEKDLGHHGEALARLTSALKCARGLSRDSDVISEVLRRRAEVYLALGRLRDADRDLREALSVCRTIGDRLEEGCVLRVLAALDYARGRLSHARRYGERAESILRRTGATFELAMALLTDGSGLIDGLSEAGEEDAPGRRGTLLRDTVEARLCTARELFSAVGSDYWAAVCALEIARAMRGLGEYERASVWLGSARPELETGGSDADRRVLNRLDSELSRIVAGSFSGRDRYSFMARAAAVLRSRVEDAQSLHSFTSLVAEGVSADRVVLFRCGDERTPTVVTTADATGRRLAEVRRFVRSTLEAGPSALPLVAGTSHTGGRLGVPSFLAAVALMPSSVDADLRDGYLLYADRIRRKGATSFGVAEVELLAAAAGLLRAESARASVPETNERAAAAFAGVIARSVRMREILDNAARLGPSDIPVLLLGESGVGKDVVARAIHEASCRRGHLLALNAAAIPRELQESELFGHVKGAFTDADRDREGLIEAAADGTLFLDEVGEMSPELQVKLLRFLQSGEYRRVGENRTRSSNARVVSASNVDLREAVAAGRFRRDLFYRLSTFVMEIPPLRERPEDIRALMQHFLTMYAQLEGKRITGFSDEVIRLFTRHDWLGNNVRELENEVRRAVAFCEEGGVVGLEHVRPELADLWNEPYDSQPRTGRGLSLKEEVETLERSRIVEALSTCSESKRSAAEMLGLSRTGLYTKMKKYGIA
jgi:DNA-binding NtrC family response regulator/tetratricopeptide (TPR) repeat protein